MFNTKKIVEAAMFIALTAALLIIDRQFAFVFDYFINILVAALIIIYITKHDFKGGLMLCFGILVITFLFGSIYSWLYMPLSALAGLGYAYMLKKYDNYHYALFTTVLVYALGEMLFTCLILPLLGFESFDEIFRSLKAVFDNLPIALDEAAFMKLAKMLYVTSAALTGVLEAYLIHLFTALIFKKFRIKVIKPVNLRNLILPKGLAYACFFACFGLFGANYFLNIEPLYYTIMIGAVLAAITLVAEGIIFIITFAVLAQKRAYTLLLGIALVLFFPYAVIILLLGGFLYATGPLNNYLLHKFPELAAAENRND